MSVVDRPAMAPPLFPEIDWNRPWLTPYVAIAGELDNAPDWRPGLCELAARIELANHRGLPIRFVPQADLPPNTTYEAFISATGGVPTRDNLHDFFNALVWLSFPGVKTQLNALQADEIDRRKKEGANTAVRGKLRDAATLFDENAALLVTHDADLIEKLRAHAWEDVFIGHRDTFGQSWDVWLFGHALMEKLVKPYKAITAHAFPVVVDQTYFALPLSEKRLFLDRLVADKLKAGLMKEVFTPLPVLGIPRWWEGQDDPFYRDTAVFRPMRNLD